MNQINSTKNTLKQKRNLLQVDFSKIDQEIISLKNKATVMTHELEGLSYLPNVIKKILNEKKLTGIHNIIGNIVEVDEKFTKALEVSLNSCRNFIITDSEADSKKAIQYLKINVCSIGA